MQELFYFPKVSAANVALLKIPTPRARSEGRCAHPWARVHVRPEKLRRSDLRARARAAEAVGLDLGEARGREGLGDGEQAAFAGAGDDGVAGQRGLGADPQQGVGFVLDVRRLRVRS
jgi:hypothetical protein